MVYSGIWNLFYAAGMKHWKQKMARHVSMYLVREADPRFTEGPECHIQKYRVYSVGLEGQ